MCVKISEYPPPPGGYGCFTLGVFLFVCVLVSLFNNNRIYGEGLASKVNLSPQVTLVTVRSKVAVLLLLIHCLLLLPLGVLCLVIVLLCSILCHS